MAYSTFLLDSALEITSIPKELPLIPLQQIFLHPQLLATPDLTSNNKIFLLVVFKTYFLSFVF